MAVAKTKPIAQHPPLPPGVLLCVRVTGLAGLIVLIGSLVNWESADLLKYCAYLTVAVFFSGSIIDVPSVAGPFPLSFLFVLFGILDLTRPETVLLALVMTVVHCRWLSPPTRPALATFYAGSAVLASAVAHGAYHGAWLEAHNADPSVRLAIATIALFLLNSVPSSLIRALEQNVDFVEVWRSRYLGMLPYYAGGAAVAQLASVANRYVGWQAVLFTGPLLYLIYRSYRLYLERLEEQKRHAEAMSSLHLRTIEALALAIEAKDHTTADHIQRVQIYAMELAKELKLSNKETDALRAAALLHDIGKLAVPEYIISKPGRLTPEEFEKMKIHPVVGAEILERVQFPYPVVPIVRAHHEKWDGTGYPYGLAGERIPIGARIISAVDCLDALASDRQYRRALPIEEAIKIVQAESGKAFDPRVVDALARNSSEWERKAQEKSKHSVKLSKEVKVERGAAPAAGFESANHQPLLNKAADPADFLASIASARQEVQALFEIAHDLGNSLSLDETLSVLAVRVKKIIPYNSIAIWLQRDGVLHPEYVTGEDYRLFSSLEIPLGQGLSGWVAHTRKPIVNGNPSVEPSYLGAADKTSILRSAVAVPLEGVNGVVGVLSLYHLDRDAFTKDHLRILLGISPKIGMSIENALRFRQVESSATTDFLTSLPNARSLFLQLDAEISRARRTDQPLAVLVVDLDGFKQINDRFGHMEGDKLLRQVANNLKTTCREYDSVARMGGDEFVLVLPGLGAFDAESKSRELQETVTTSCYQLFGDKLITASVGLAYYPSDGTDAEQLLAAADRRMYKQKRDRKHLPTSERKSLAERASWDTSLVH
jgi:diguanylate cyclase (GGDEF)-like protein/putative nucleotidyltransferase with HDIG domain